MTTDAGIDIVEVARIRRLIRDRGDAFLLRWFTTDEIDYCGRKAMPERHFAARFAAKEAVAKVLPGRWDGPLPWRSIEVTSTGTGRPTVRLTGTALDVARRNGIVDIRISMSHCDEYATAIALTTPHERGRPDDQ